MAVSVSILLCKLSCGNCRSDQIKVYNCTTGQLNRITWGDVGKKWTWMWNSFWKSQLGCQARVMTLKFQFCCRKRLIHLLHETPTGQHVPHTKSKVHNQQVSVNLFMQFIQIALVRQPVIYWLILDFPGCGDSGTSGSTTTCRKNNLSTLQ